MYCPNNEKIMFVMMSSTGLNIQQVYIKAFSTSKVDETVDMLSQISMLNFSDGKN